MYTRTSCIIYNDIIVALFASRATGREPYIGTTHRYTPITHTYTYPYDTPLQDSRYNTV